MIWEKLATKEGMVDVVLVDIHGEKVGLLEKYAAHRNPGFLHKAISVVLYRITNSKSEILNSKQILNTKVLNTKPNVEVLLQKRSEKKPLWPHAWADTCSTHQLDGETDEDCAVRRLKFEMGMEVDKKGLKTLYKYRYQVVYDHKLAEHELNSVLVGKWDGNYEINRDEVSEAKWINWEELREDVEKHENKYAPWFVLMVKDQKLINYLSKV